MNYQKKLSIRMKNLYYFNWKLFWKMENTVVGQHVVRIGIKINVLTIFSSLLPINIGRKIS